MGSAGYDPFAPGPVAVGERTFEATDPARGRVFPITIWHPADGGEAQRPHALVVVSHSSGGNRRSAAFLSAHLASHGYAVAALDHSELVTRELARREGETPAERSTRIDAVIASRVPDVRFLLDQMLAGAGGARGIALETTRVGLVGHSFGGWTVLATPEVEPRVHAVVAMGPGGCSQPKPGILRLELTFAWGRDVPTLYLAAEDDIQIPLACVSELYERTRATKRMFILRRADHQHFLDDIEAAHESLRAMSLLGEAAWIPAATRPMAELCPPDAAHAFVRGLTLAHFDATLRESRAAEQFLAGDILAELAAHGVDATAR